MECHRLAPRLFSWAKYRDQVNLELVRVGLSDGKKPAYGGFISGTGSKGWRLTAAGLIAVARLPVSSSEMATATPTRQQSLFISRTNRETARVFGSTAWVEWKDGRAVTVSSVRELLRVDEYSSDERVGEKVQKLAQILARDSDGEKFLNEVGRVLNEVRKEKGHG
jgi:hypothetical protein